MMEAALAFPGDDLGSLARFPPINQSRLPPTPVLVKVKRSALRMNSRRRRKSGSGVISEEGGALPNVSISCDVMQRECPTFPSWCDSDTARSIRTGAPTQLLRRQASGRGLSWKSAHASRCRAARYSERLQYPRAPDRADGGPAPSSLGFSAATAAL